MNHTTISADNNSTAAGNDLYHQCVFGSPSFLEKYEIHDLDSAMSSVLSELNHERIKLRKNITKTSILNSSVHLCFLGIGSCAIYLCIGLITTHKIGQQATLLVLALLIAIVTVLLKPTGCSKQEERMQEKKVDVIYEILGRLQEEQIWRRIKSNTSGKQERNGYQDKHYSC